MIVSGYSLELYCDCDSCTQYRDSPYSTSYPKIYAGETYSECAKQAKAEGWYLSRDKMNCIAPGHDRGNK